MNRPSVALKYILDTILFCLLLLAACNPSPDQIEHIKPTILQHKDFFYWSWEPDIEPNYPSWPQVVPPEDLTKHFILAGYAGDMENVEFDEGWNTGCHSEPTCTKFSFSPGVGNLGFAGNLWVDVIYPKYSLGINLESVSGLTFWAKGENGGEKIEFRVGSTAGVAPQPEFSTGIVTLQATWQQYTIEFTDKAYLDRVFSGFSWLTTEDLNLHGCVFYLDDLRFR